MYLNYLDYEEAMKKKKKNGNYNGASLTEYLGRSS